MAQYSGARLRQWQQADPVRTATDLKPAFFEQLRAFARSTRIPEGLAQGGEAGVTGWILPRHQIQRSALHAIGSEFGDPYPGDCPGEGWQLMSTPGRRGQQGPRGGPGERGPAGPTIQSWQINWERYQATPLMSDRSLGPTFELRPLFEHFHNEAR
jgi:hypothetical protein